MKLSDKDLHYALWCAEKHTGNSLYEEAAADLDDGVLEIEGFERVQWTRFDPQNPNTFPPFGRYLCVSTNDGEVDVAYRSDKCTDEIFASLPHDMEYWRPLPKSPIENRDEWIKVVLGDPKTFPPRDKDVILAQRDKIIGLHQPLPICFEPKEKNFERLPCFGGEFITHWRLAPNPPTETE